jgi:protein SCO1/2
MLLSAVVIHRISVFPAYQAVWRKWLLRRRTILLLLCMSLVSEVQAGPGRSYTRTIENYEVPQVTLVNQDGLRVDLRKLLASDRPVLVDFVYTTCTTICPVLSINFANFQKTLVEESAKVQLVSITVDPEFDTPKAIKAYLKRYGAKPGWDYLTGSREDITRVLKAFNAYTLNKMDHYPIILLKSPSDKQWVRVYGLIGTNELLVEYEKVCR